jgi:hypothetical protein
MQKKKGGDTKRQEAQLMHGEGCFARKKIERGIVCLSGLPHGMQITMQNKFAETSTHVLIKERRVKNEKNSKIIPIYFGTKKCG